MSNTTKQSPLGANSLGSLLQNTGFTINPVVAAHVGASKNYTSYTPGTIVSDTVLKPLTWAINDGYTRGLVNSTTYNNLISIGSTTIPALGNAKAPTYTYTGPANQGDSQSASNYQNLSWNPYNNINPVTQWGYVRLVALQAWNEFNWNGEHDASSVEYKDFTQSFMTAYSFIEYTNVGINALQSAPTFLKGTYSNMNDLITADITGVSLSTNIFGQDLIALGKAINLQRIDAFGLPSVLLGTLKQYNAITQSVSLALLSSGLQPAEIDQITSEAITPTSHQERMIYGAFLIIKGVDLDDVLVPLNCKTQGLDTLADLLNPMKLFPKSYQTLTVPIFNITPASTNSKTYYPIYNSNGLNSALNGPAVVSQTAGMQIPMGPPIVTPRNITYESTAATASSTSAAALINGGSKITAVTSGATP